MTIRKKIEDGGPAFPQLDVTSCERDGHGDLIDPFTSAAGGMSDLSSLIARLEKSEASFDLECGIAAALEPERGQAGLKPRAYLTSVDAAIALTSSTLPGWRYAVERRAAGMCLAWVSEEDDAPCIPAMHRDTAIALVLATLRALQQKGSSNG